ncbi:terpene cyclase [Pleurotus pulmonarius]|nr:terpene cyclase [Pleurotus pulmonarius]KAF4607473.1 terpene cyclase [Pleurotus pulmonarius]
MLSTTPLRDPGNSLAPLLCVQCKEKDVDLDALRDVIRKFVSRIPHVIMRFDPPPTAALQAAVKTELCALKVPLHLIERWIRWSCQVVECFYPLHILELKVLLAICNIIIFHIDDTLSRTPAILLSFQLNIAMGRPQNEPILACLANDILPRMWSYFHPLAANAIVIGFQEFINGTIMENMARSILPISTSAPSFPEYVRLKSGAPAPYAFWLFPRDSHPDVRTYIQAIPDLMAFINRVNDILSLYKEELAGEDDNYVHMRSTLSSRNIVDTVKEICDETIAEMDRITVTLSHDPAAQATFQGYVSGYLRFHFSTTRYRLEDLFGDL